MLRDNVWRQANPEYEGMLCIGCVEKRLRRKLTPDDFSNYPINWNLKCGCNDWVNQRSLRLRRRLGFVR